MGTKEEPLNARTRVLEAATRLVAREGAKGLTIAAVSREAGLSRGGVFYHFPSKEAIIQGMLAHLIAEFERHLDAEAARDPEPGGRWARAFVRASFAMEEPTASAFTALIAAIAEDPRLLDPLREHLARWRTKTEEGLDTTTAAVVRLTSHALWLNGLFGINDLRDEERHAVIDRIVTLTATREGTSPTDA